MAELGKKERPGVDPREVVAAVLAGGQARRFGGRVKPLVEVGGISILARQLAVLAARFDEIVIAANDPAPYRAFGLPVIADRVVGVGPLAGIAAALAATDRRFLFAIAGDMPFLTTDALDAVLAAGGDGVDLVVPVHGGRPEPLHALYSRRCLPVIERQLADGRYQASGLLSVPELVAITIDADAIGARFLTNVNSPRDLP